MDNKELELYLEEQRIQLINLNQNISKLQELIEKQISIYKPPANEVKVSGKVDVNTEKSIEVNNLTELKQWLSELGKTVDRSIKENTKEPIKEITVKNIKDAQQSEIKVTNFIELTKFFKDLNQNILNLPQPIVNVEKQDVQLPTAPNKAIAVRLSDGKSFYNAITSITNAATNFDSESIIETIQKKGQTDVFNQQIIGTRNNQLEVDFSNADPDTITTLTVTKTNGGDASTSGGQAVFETSTNTSGEIKAITTRTVTYHPHAENYAAFTAIFTNGIVNSYQRIGLYDDNNGFFVGYEGTSFGVTKRSGASDTFVARASFSEDTLSGQSSSKYTRNGVPEALDPTKDNLYRLRYGWLGAAPIYYEVLSPDGEWVTFHIIKHPNTGAVPTVQEPNQPLRVHIKKTTAGTTNLSIKTACWAAGTSSDLQKITETLYDETLAKTVRSVITGKTTAGGGGYVNVKVNPSGALTTDSTISGTVTAESPIYYKRLDDTTTSNMIYIGEAQPGTATSAASWRIKRLDLTSGLIIQWAGSGAFSQIWDNRAALTYS